MRNSERKDISQEAISMEEYLSKRQKIKEAQQRRRSREKEKSPAWMWACSLPRIFGGALLVGGRAAVLDIFVHQSVGVQKDGDDKGADDGGFQKAHCL